MFTNHDFSNYRNLARRAESAGHKEDELRLLNKCLEIYEFRKGRDCSAQTFLDMVNRINFLRSASID